MPEKKVPAIPSSPKSKKGNQEKIATSVSVDKKTAVIFAGLCYADGTSYTDAVKEGVKLWIDKKRQEGVEPVSEEEIQQMIDEELAEKQRKEEEKKKRAEELKAKKEAAAKK